MQFALQQCLGVVCFYVDTEQHEDATEWGKKSERNANIKNC